MLVRDLLIMKKLKLKIGRGFCYVDHRLHMNDEIICIIVLLLFYLSLVNLNAFLFFSSFFLALIPLLILTIKYMFLHFQDEFLYLCQQKE
jgi:hypothetical protein